MDKRKLAAAVSGLVLVGGLSAGAAWAQASGSAPTTSQRSAGQQETTSPDTDNLQQGDQKSPDGTGEAEPNEKAESKEGTEQESKSEEAGDEKLPGGGHADPEGRNVDHQFEGVE